MAVIDRGTSETSTVKQRLIEAAHDEITEFGLDNLQMDAVARRAGVSRATAFRQLGGISELVIQVALLRSDRHREVLNQIMANKVGVFAKLEAALVFSARELPADPPIAALIARHSESAQDPRVRRRALDVLGQVLLAGQESGEIRTDLELDELVDFIVEQTYLAADDVHRSEAASRRRFRHFVVPAISARELCSGELASRITEVHAASEAARDALDALTQTLQIARP
ncbi:AcrR family transcriptional regulator [Mycolicibacterium sp. BK556]|uniref:TetR/AcrR family transcriptional regulator n=1 Tax=Mycobacteriaceae TaxID=1762 RepID=UPI0010EE8031|nr:TetR/AcrR family transcriptional regulator [Mycobacterium sp. BK086]MBB3604768.1 AcrR family transcriptional regulator [Mycolicibacterium sp. BK556]MBB3634519.1 AcrR family transcriptional regulator [Mycolicibacterium sp. BK607]MBB3752096.1 AcrR family transcriptional regulator [Mycolicibacterium sp. BK634]TDO17657.1 TetR family transcriptional regulator [Mycobacterium sp. BK086]